MVFAISVGVLELFRTKTFPRLVVVRAMDNGSVPYCQEIGKPDRVIKVIVSAYSSSPDQTDDTPCITSTGYDVCRGYALYGAANTVASNSLPVNTILKIPELFGDEIFVVRDRMNQRYGSQRIDIWFPTRGEAIEFGTKLVDVEVYD